MMRLTDKEAAALSKQTGLSPKALNRIISSCKVLVSSMDAESEPKSLELGLNLHEGASGISPQVAVSLLSPLLQEYRRTCPQALAWLGRGDFSPDRIPHEVSRGMIVHACRTAGRLRAQFFRKTEAKVRGTQ